MEYKRKLRLSIYTLTIVAILFIGVFIILTSGRFQKQTSEQIRLQDSGHKADTQSEKPPTGFLIVDPQRLPKEISLTRSSFRSDLVSYTLSVQTPNGVADVYIVENSTDDFDDSMQSNLASERQDVRLEREFEFNNSKGVILTEYPLYGYKTSPDAYLLLYDHGDNLVRMSTSAVDNITPDDLIELLPFLLNGE